MLCGTSSQKVSRLFALVQPINMWNGDNIATVWVLQEHQFNVPQRPQLIATCFNFNSMSSLIKFEFDSVVLDYLVGL